MNDEVRHYLLILDDLRDQLAAIIHDLPAEALNWRPMDKEGGHAVNSLAVLATHVAGAEHYWMGEVIGGRPATRQRDTEFVAQAEDASDLVEVLRSSGWQTRAVLSELTLDDLAQSRETRGKPVTTRWAILHVIEHTALHVGHMQLTLQLWQGGRAHPDARWFQRVPPPE